MMCCIAIEIIPHKSLLNRDTQFLFYKQLL